MGSLDTAHLPPSLNGTVLSLELALGFWNWTSYFSYKLIYPSEKLLFATWFWNALWKLFFWMTHYHTIIVASCHVNDYPSVSLVITLAHKRVRPPPKRCCQQSCPQTTMLSNIHVLKRSCQQAIIPVNKNSTSFDIFSHPLARSRSFAPAVMAIGVTERVRR